MVGGALWVRVNVAEWFHKYKAGVVDRAFPSDSRRLVCVREEMRMVTVFLT